MKGARKVIELFLTHRDGAKLWWVNETPHRSKYGLTTDHETELIELLKVKFPRGE